MKQTLQRLACCAGLLLAVSGPASSHPHSATKRGGPHGSPAAAMSYEQQRAMCMKQTTRTAENCMKEMAAARQAAQRGNLVERDEEIYKRNRLQRCNALPSADRDNCVARLMAPTAVSGSVAGGGVLYESKEIVPAGTPGSRVIPGSAVVPGAVIVPREALKP